MYVTVQVSADVARVLQRQAPPTSESNKLVQILKDLGVVLKPVHHGAEDPLLIPYFTIEVSDITTAKRVIARLQHSNVIEAAYLKPPDESPFG